MLLNINCREFEFLLKKNSEMCMKYILKYWMIKMWINFIFGIKVKGIFDYKYLDCLVWKKFEK